jgi:hypothetical protein
MNILGVNGKPVVVGGKVILPPSGVDVRLNAITPERYQYVEDENKATLDLSGLITGNYFICFFSFEGIQRINGKSVEITISFQSMGSNFMGGAIRGTGVFFYRDGSNGAASINAYLESGSDHVYDISNDFTTLLDSEGYIMANCRIDQVNASYVVSWN